MKREEIFKDIPGYENMYQVCDDLKVYALHFGRLKGKKKSLIPHIDIGGYEIVKLCKEGKYKSFRVHRLIAIGFIPNPWNKPYVNHINGIKRDNRVGNLEWVTSKENNDHAMTIGLRESDAMYEISRKTVINTITKKEYSSGKQCYQTENIKAIYGVSYKTFLNMLNGNNSHSNKTEYAYS